MQWRSGGCLSIYRKDISIFLYIVIWIIITINITFAGTLSDADGITVYLNDYGEIAKDTWVWIDTDKDSIAECYRFDKYGQIAKNYVDKYGRTSNEKGQLIENGEVIKKMLSNGEILNKRETPANYILGFLGNIINPKDKYSKDELTGKEMKEYETNSIRDIIDGQIIYSKNAGDVVDILNGETAENGIIYANGKASEISDGVEDNREIVAGKDLRRFISAKNKCIEKVSSVYVYGGIYWTDAIALNGNEASIKLTLDENNYIYFEVAHSNHSKEEKDIDITLDMYVDGKLYDSFDEFVDAKPQIVEDYFENAKTIELRVSIGSGAKSRSVYIRNGRLKKTKIKDK